MDNPLDQSDDLNGAPDDLCRRMRASDRTALEDVFRRFRDELLRYVRGIVRRESVAHDLVQDVFIDLWGTRHSLDPNGSLKAYLYGMARNRAFRYLRDTRAHVVKHALLQREADAGTPSDGARDHDIDAGLLGEMLHQWISELPERQQEALMLSRYHDLTHREIASVMRISPRTVNNHIIRALRNLNERIQRFEPAILP